MKISKEARRNSRLLFRACLVNGKLDESRAKDVVGKVAAAKPRGYMGILQAFSSLVKMEIERQLAVVECATPLTNEMQANLKTSLSQKYGRDLTLDFQIRPELLGGIRVKVGSDVWDGSVKARLEALKASLS
jgi:F-type H+-transporting ATPase subunit delta